MKHFCFFYRSCHGKEFLTYRYFLQSICYGQYSSHIVYHTANIQRQSFFRNASSCYVPYQDLFISRRIESL